MNLGLLGWVITALLPLRGLALEGGTPVQQPGVTISGAAVTQTPNQAGGVPTAVQSVPMDGQVGIESLEPVVDPANPAAIPSRMRAQVRFGARLDRVGFFSDAQCSKVLFSLTSTQEKNLFGAREPVMTNPFQRILSEFWVQGFRGSKEVTPCLARGNPLVLLGAKLVLKGDPPTILGGGATGTGLRLRLPGFNPAPDLAQKGVAAEVSLYADGSCKQPLALDAGAGTLSLKGVQNFMDQAAVSAIDASKLPAWKDFTLEPGRSHPVDLFVRMIWPPSAERPYRLDSGCRPAGAVQLRLALELPRFGDSLSAGETKILFSKWDVPVPPRLSCGWFNDPVPEQIQAVDVYQCDCSEQNRVMTFTRQQIAAMGKEGCASPRMSNSIRHRGECPLFVRERVATDLSMPCSRLGSLQGEWRDPRLLVSEKAGTGSLPSIRIKFRGPLVGVGVLHRRSPGQRDWSLMADSFTGEYEDRTVQAGGRYVYRLQEGGMARRIHYASSAWDAQPIESRGGLLILVDGALREELGNELARYSLDAIQDGYWPVELRSVARSDAPKNVKGGIAEVYRRMDSTGARLTSLFLVGQIPIPYSGVGQRIDGHCDHYGAWPSDYFYSDLKGSWTDTQVDGHLPPEKCLNGWNSQPPAQNLNTPGDGKFDQVFLPRDGEAALALGRVDFRGFEATGVSEVQLIKNYLLKLHAFKTGVFRPSEQTLVTYTDGFPSVGDLGQDLRSQAPQRWVIAAGAGKGVDHFVSVSNAASFLWSQHRGWGAYNSIAMGSGDAKGFNTWDPRDHLQRSRVKRRVTFYSLMGSYLGDWNFPLNVLRAPLVALDPNPVQSGEWGLASFYTQNWLLHGVGWGESLGEAGRLSTNERLNEVSHSLMGDPTLRSHYPSGVSLVYERTQSGLAESIRLEVGPGGVAPSPVPGEGSRRVVRIYGRKGAQGEFARIRDVPFSEASYNLKTDRELSKYTCFMARVLEPRPLPDPGAGSYWNPSLGSKPVCRGLGQ